MNTGSYLGRAAFRASGLALIALCHVGAAAIAAPAVATADQEIAIWQVRANIYMLVGPGGNVTAQIGDDGIVLVDTMTGETTERLLAAIRQISNRPIRYIINTQGDVDHTGGNAFIAQKGETVTGGNVKRFVTDANVGAAVIAQENVLTSMSTSNPPAPFEGLPTSTYITKTKTLFVNGEGVEIEHPGRAHTSGDSIVFFRRSDVVSAGDVFTPTRYPVLDSANGGTLQGIIDALNLIIELTIPEDKQEGGTLVIPGHGGLCDEADVVEYRDMLTIVQDFIREMIKEGKTLEQIQNAQPTMGYDGMYGSDSGPWTTKQFVAAVYQELRKAR